MSFSRLLTTLTVSLLASTLVTGDYNVCDDEKASKIKRLDIGEWVARPKESPNCVSSFYLTEPSYLGIKSEQILPNHCIDKENKQICFIDSDSSEQGLLFVFVTVVLLLMTVCMNCRSMNPYRVDLFRTNAIYIIGTMLFTLFSNVGGSAPGFHRPTAFGVMTHNLAGLFFLKNIWFGRVGRGLTSWFVSILYIWMMCMFLVLIPINYLYWFAMFQGASMDFCLVYTFAIISSQLKKKQKRQEKEDPDAKWSYGWNYCSYIVAMVAAIIHISSIIPMFFGMAVGNALFTAITVLMVFPTFAVYTMFVARDLGRIAFLGSSFSQKIDLVLDLSSSLKPIKKIRLLEALEDTGDYGNTELQVGSLIEMHKRKEDEEKNDGGDEKDSGSGSGAKAGEDDSHLDLLENMRRDKTNFFQGVKRQNIQQAEMMQNVGALRYFWGVGPDGKCHCGGKWKDFWFAVGFGILSSLIASFTVWFSPCFLEVACYA